MTGDRMLDALNLVCKWRRVFTGQMFGTRSDKDPVTAGMNDLQEARIIGRVELSAVISLLLQKKVFTPAEFAAAIELEAGRLNTDYARRFPGFTATPDGIEMDVALTSETMKRQPWAK